MGCTSSTALENITFTCDDKPKGGIDELLIVRTADITEVSDTDGVLDVTFAATSVSRIDFNKKDGFSIAGTEYAGEPDGTDAFTPSISVEIPRITVDKLQAIGVMTGGFNELVVLVKMRTGLEFAYGYDNGLFINAATSTSGTNADKNTIQATFSGDEDSFERSLSAGVWALAEAALVS